MELEAKVDERLFIMAHPNSYNKVYTVDLSWEDESTFVLRDEYKPFVYVKSRLSRSKVEGKRVGYNKFTFSLGEDNLQSAVPTKWINLDVVIDIGNGERIIANPTKVIEFYVEGK